MGIEVPQITLYLDDETAHMMRERAAACGMPNSRWVANLIRSQAPTTWPQDLIDTFGRLPDMPLAGDLRSHDVVDAPRVQW